MTIADQSTHSITLSGVEELDEAARALGWNIEYRQMRKGDFRAEFAILECDGIHLASERFNNHLHVHAEPPGGFVGLFLPRFAAGRARVCGRVLTEGELVAFPSRSELEVVTRDEIRNETLFMAEAEFRAAARSLAPSDAVLSPGSAAVYHGDARRFEAIQREIDSVHARGSLDSETASHLLAETILWMADASPSFSAEPLGDGVSAAVARRAQTFIEEKLRDTIRLEDLCSFAGVGLRTLQRCFASHFQISPTDYIKARRLNAARRDLVAADPSSHSVTRIAMENGFSHLGRFSVEYRGHFGESPSETLAATGSSGRTPLLVQ